jgi:hypothetical protein
MMAIPESNLPHLQLERARQYKAEFLMKMYGATFASINGITDASSIFDVVSEDSNIVGLGFGLKVTGGDATEQEAVRVYVREKIAFAYLERRIIIPSEVNGLPTDVVPVEDLVAAMRPTPCGVSVGHYSITAGTLGCLVKKADENDLYILSNNHVLANCDKAHIGDVILQPGPSDGGGINDQLAHLADFEPITLGGNPKSIDAAIAKLSDPNSVTKNIKLIGDVQSPPMQAAFNQRVLKHGRTTKLTEGEVVGIAEDVRVRFGSQMIEFEEQLAIQGVGQPFAHLGDSGSLVVDAHSLRAVGLLFCVDLGQGGTVFANPITTVLGRFSVEIL